jgi:predicted nucleotide-binding protein
LAKINQELIDRIADQLGIGVAAVYVRIQKIVKETGLERDLAALVLARRNDININKFSTLAQRSEIRGNTPVPAGEQEPERERGPLQPPRRAANAKKPARKTKGKSVFVVHGRDEALRKSMFDFLRALGLHPMEWDHALKQARSKGANPYVGDILDEVMEKAQAVVVMFSPDDLVQLKEQFLHADDRATESKPQGQARPNVLFEAGLAMGRQGRNHAFQSLNPDIFTFQIKENSRAIFTVDFPALHKSNKSLRLTRQHNSHSAVRHHYLSNTKFVFRVIRVQRLIDKTRECRSGRSRFYVNIHFLNSSEPTRKSGFESMLC